MCVYYIYICDVVEVIKGYGEFAAVHIKLNIYCYIVFQRREIEQKSNERWIFPRSVYVFFFLSFSFSPSISVCFFCAIKEGKKKKIDWSEFERISKSENERTKERKRGKKIRNVKKYPTNTMHEVCKKWLKLSSFFSLLTKP